jgi:CheY-like chemotaxis protein
VLARAFEPFFTTKAVGKGTGLGLASVYGSIKQSGGFIYAKSQPGQGTEFSIYLPRLLALTPVTESAAAPVLVPTGGETLLLVEDSTEVRVLASLILNSAGYTVLEAADGAEALAVAQAHAAPIHLLVTDLVMPRMGGRQLAERLHALRPDLKVLYLSGYTESSLTGGGVKQSGVAFLQKPYGPGALTQKVREVLDGKPK